MPWAFGKRVRPPRYCPPEQHIDLHHPYTYDTYSAALVWLRLAVPEPARKALHLDMVVVRIFRHPLDSILLPLVPHYYVLKQYL